MSTTWRTLENNAQLQPDGLLAHKSTSRSNGIHNVVLTLFILVPILSGTVFKSAQIAIELALIVLLTALVTRHRLTREDLLLLAVFGVSQSISFVLNDLNVFMLDAKQFALPILTFLYFRRTHFTTPLIGFAFALNAFLTLYQLLAGQFILDIADVLTVFKDYASARPLGLFLNFHFSAYFCGVYLIYLSRIKKLYMADFAFLYFTGVKTVLVSYLAQRIARLNVVRSSVLRNRLTSTLAICGALTLVYFGAEFILGLAQTMEFGYNSLLVIYRQALDPIAYLALMTPYPGDATGYTESVRWDYADVGFGQIGNEIALFSIFTQGGSVLASIYLFLLTKYLKHFRVFFWISLLHYGFVLSPLIVYLMVTYETEIRKRSAE